MPDIWRPRAHDQHRRFRWLAAGLFWKTHAGKDTCESVVIYCPDDDEHTIHVREQSDFLKTFEPCVGDGALTT